MFRLLTPEEKEQRLKLYDGWWESLGYIEKSRIYDFVHEVTWDRTKFVPEGSDVPPYMLGLRKDAQTDVRIQASTIRSTPRLNSYI